MNANEVKLLAHAIGTSMTIPVQHRKGIAVDIANTLMWSGERRKVFLALVAKAIRRELEGRQHP